MIPEILKEVCSETEERYDLSTPYPLGSYVYGTDGKIMVRCPRTDFETVEDPDRKFPDPERVIRLVDGSDGIRVPLPEAVESVPCDECAGSGLTDRLTCEYCENVFDIRFRGKPVLVDCPECDGLGTVPNTAAVKVCDAPRVYLMARYVALLRRHGVESAEVRDGKPATFSGPGFEGWLMPMNTESVEEKLVNQGGSR